MNWAFANPLLLAGLAAIGLPLFIHWLTRARPRRIAFPPFKFLVEACAGQQRVHRLRTFILLTLRCLLVAVLALLFARPFLKPKGATTQGNAPQRVALVLDASLSMRAVHDGVQLFARAQAEAAEVLRSLPAGSEAAVILEGAAPHSLLPALSENVPALHDLLVQSRPTFECGDPAAALTLAGKILNGNGAIYVFSDFQRANWASVQELPGGITCKLRPVALAAVDNVAITGTRLVPATPVIGEAVEVSCTVFNCSAQPREETVRLELADFSGETHVTLPPFSTADAAFNLALPHAGSFAGKVSLPPDNLPEDNTRYVSANVGNALQVVLVSDADESDWNSPAFYISRALAPSPQAAPGINLGRRRGQDLDRGILETADVFCLAPPVTLSGEAMEIIARRVNEGARLISFLDGPTAPALIFPMLNPPFQLERTTASAVGDAVALGAQKVFGELEAGDFSATRFHRHFQNHPPGNRATETILAYADGSAALTISPAGRGSLVLVNLPLTPDGGDFVGNPVFPALLHELLRALRQDSGEKPVTPGGLWTWDVPASGEGPVTITDPDGKKVEAQVLARGRTTRLALPPAAIPGVYAAKQAGALAATAVVNVDPRESDTRPLAVETLKSGPNSTVTLLRGEEEVAAGEKTVELWPRLAEAAVILLGLEMLLLALWRTPKTQPAEVTS